MNVITPERVLALDVHRLSFGFAMFEGPGELLDWGIKNFRQGVKVPMNMKLVLLLDKYRPDTVLIKEPRTAALKKLVRAITALAERRRIPVQIISRPSVRSAFPEENYNKYQIASVIATRYPELSPRLGIRRKVWESEKYSMSIFDAAAIGNAYFIHEAMRDNGDGNLLAASSLTHRP